MTPSKTPSIAIGVAVYVVLGLVAAFVTFSGGMATQSIGGILSCLVALAAPVVAVWHYTSTHALTLPAGQGAALGAIASATGAVVSGLLSWALQQVGVFPTAAEVMEQQRDQLIAQGNMSPEDVDQMMEVMGGMGDNLLLQLGIGVLIGAVVGAIAGAVAAAIFKKGDPELV